MGCALETTSEESCCFFSLLLLLHLIYPSEIIFSLQFFNFSQVHMFDTEIHFISRWISFGSSTVVNVLTIPYSWYNVRNEWANKFLMRQPNILEKKYINIKLPFHLSLFMWWKGIGKEQWTKILSGRVLPCLHCFQSVYLLLNLGME